MIMEEVAKDFYYRTDSLTDFETFPIRARSPKDHLFGCYSRILELRGLFVFVNIPFSVDVDICMEPI